MIDQLVDRLHPLRTPASQSAILATERALDRVFAPDYKSFLRRTNGFEGSPSERFYLQLSSIEDVPRFQRWGGEVDRPDLVWFGGDGGGQGFFFDYTTTGPTVLMIDYISDWTTDALWCGASFTDFLLRTLEGRDPFNGPGAHHA